MTNIMHTTYQGTGASNLLAYMSKEEGQGLENRYGREMTDAEIQAFVDKSERHEFERDMIISPKNREELTDDELSLYTRQTMSEWSEDRPTADYCYAIHRDTENPHVHVAVTGEKEDLEMYPDEINHFREQTIERNYVEQHNEQTPTLAPEHEHERVTDREHEHEHENEHEQEFYR